VPLSSLDSRTLMTRWQDRCGGRMCEHDGIVVPSLCREFESTFCPLRIETWSRLCLSEGVVENTLVRCSL
jgi:hypothetical protein